MTYHINRIRKEIRSVINTKKAFTKTQYPIMINTLNIEGREEGNVPNLTKS